MTKRAPSKATFSQAPRVIALPNKQRQRASNAAHDARADHRTVWTVGALVVVLTAGAYLPSPLYPVYQRLFSYDDLVMTLLFAVFALVSGPTLLLFGPAADTLGHGPMLRLSVLFAAAGSCCFLLADTPAWLFAGRAGQGLALGTATGAAQALITLRRSPAARISGPLFASLTFVAGTAAGPFVAGLLAQYVPAPTTVPYLLHLGLLAVVWVRLDRCVPGPVGAGLSLRRWRPASLYIPRGIRGVFAVASLSGCMAWCVVGIYLAVVPALLERVTHSHNPALVGGILAGVLLCSMLAQLAATQTTAAVAQLRGIAFLSGSLVLLAGTGASWLPSTLLAALLAGIGHGFAFGGAATAVEARTPAKHRAGVGAALYLFFYLGSAVPAVVVGALSGWLPLSNAVTWLSWIIAGIGAIALPLVRAASATQGGVSLRPKPTMFPARAISRRVAGPSRQARSRAGVASKRRPRKASRRRTRSLSSATAIAPCDERPVEAADSSNGESLLRVLERAAPCRGCEKTKRRDRIV